MNRVVNRAGIMLFFVAVLAVGTLFFVFEYLFCSPGWVMSEGSPHVYTDYSTVCGVITDRDGVLLMDTTDGRKDAGSQSLRPATLQWLGDRQGSISAPAVTNYAKEIRTITCFWRNSKDGKF